MRKAGSSYWIEADNSFYSHCRCGRWENGRCRAGPRIPRRALARFLMGRRLEARRHSAVPKSELPQAHRHRGNPRFSGHGLDHRKPRIGHQKALSLAPLRLKGCFWIRSEDIHPPRSGICKAEKRRGVGIIKKPSIHDVPQAQLLGHHSLIYDFYT